MRPLAARSPESRTGPGRRSWGAGDLPITATDPSWRLHRPRRRAPADRHSNL